MRLPSFLITAPLLCTAAIADPAHQPPHNQLDAFVNAERAIALQGALNNIGPNGSAVPGAGAGYVVASPSKENPNYFYTWSRDSALTLKMLIDEFIFGNRSLQPVIEDYIHAQAVLQTVSNPSGPFLPQGVGLGEPKFLVDGTRFNGAWGRPQRDGPALRATALMTYSSWLIKEGKISEAKNIIWPIISNDLSYVGQYWNQTGFDLWEETDGSSFFTLQNQYRALVEGAQLAKILHVTCTGCSQAPELLCFLQGFWNGAHIVSNINVNNGRTGLDANSILGSIAVFDIDADCDSLTWQPCHSQSLANFKVLTDTFRALYDINKNISEGHGAAIGRYPEDVYMGGNPWYLITTAAAEFLYDAVAQWKARGSVKVDSTSMAFFKDIYPKVAARQYNSRDAGFAQIMNGVTAYADSYVTVAQKYIPTDGSLSEQFDRETGAPTSAIDLTWSYAAFVTMAQRRAGQYPASWGSRTAVAPPATCSGTSKQGVYAPATAAGAPNVTSSCQILAQFNVNATTYFGENIYIVGNTTDLGAWDLDNSYPLSAGFYTSERPLWNGSIYLTAGETINYKYARQEDCNQPWIYETENRTLVIPPCGGASITTDDAWIGQVGTSGNC